MLLIVGRDAERPRVFRDSDVHRGPGAIDSLLELADAGQILIKLAAVGGAQSLTELAGIVADEVEYALISSNCSGRVFAAGCFGGAAEEAIEDQARVDLLGDRRRFAAPRKVRLISTTITVITFTGVLAPLAT